jgi:phage-related baseplate assembly protein
MRQYTVYYTKVTQGQIDVFASSPTEAESIVEGYTGSDFGLAREYDEPIEIYDVEDSDGRA